MWCSAGMISISTAVHQRFSSYSGNRWDTDDLISDASRRSFFRTLSGMAPTLLMPKLGSRQSLLAGVIPVGKTTVQNGRSEVLQYCDEIAHLGFHRYEVNSTRAAIAEYYVDRSSEFKEQMSIPGSSIY